MFGVQHAAFTAASSFLAILVVESAHLVLASSGCSSRIGVVVEAAVSSSTRGSFLATGVAAAAAAAGGDAASESASGAGSVRDVERLTLAVGAEAYGVDVAVVVVVTEGVGEAGGFGRGCRGF